MLAVRLTSKGQVTLPKILRDRLKLKKGDILGFSITGDHVQMIRLGNAEDFYGSVKVGGKQDFKKIRSKTKELVARKIADEGK